MTDPRRLIFFLFFFCLLFYRRVWTVFYSSALPYSCLPWLNDLMYLPWVPAHVCHCFQIKGQESRTTFMTLRGLSVPWWRQRAATIYIFICQLSGPGFPWWPTGCLLYLIKRPLNREKGTAGACSLSINPTIDDLILERVRFKLADSQNLDGLWGCGHVTAFTSI